MAIIPDPSGDAPLAPYISYDEIGTVSGVTSYQFYITGAGTSSYSSRTIRYKLDDVEWTYSMNHDFVREDSTTRLQLSRPQGKTLTVEAWTTDEISMIDSPATTVVIADSEVYANKLYVAGTTDNFDAENQVPRTGSVDIEIEGKKIKITKTSSGSGTYHYGIFPIENTDELIGKKVRLSGKFRTSGNFTSAARLWWLNATNTGILSGPVASIEFIGNSGSYYKTGYIPAKPENAGKLAILGYSNVTSASQGAYTVFDGLELTADLSDNASHKPDKVYFSYANYFDGFNADHQNSTRVILERISDGDLKLIKNVSGSTGYTWLCFPIERTDELLNKRIRITGSFETSGNFTSGPRLFWLNEAGTYHTTLVEGFEQLSNSGKIFIEGQLPARPSGSGKLGLYLYANISNANPGVYTVYKDVKIELVKNNLLYDTGTRTNTGITTSVSNNVYTISGTATGQWVSLTPNISFDKIPRGTPMTVSANPTFNSAAKLYSRLYRNEGLTSYNGVTLANDAPAATMVFDNYDTFGAQLYLNTSADTVVNKVSSIQIERGMNELTTPNLIDMTMLGSGTVNGLTYNVDSDGTVRIRGTSTAAGHINMNFTIPSNMVGKTLTMYWEGSVKGVDNLGLKNNTSDVGSLGILGTSTKARSFVVTSANQAAVSKFDIYWSAANRVFDCAFKFYVQEGSCARPFSQYPSSKTHRAVKVYGSENGVTKLLYTI